MVAVAVPAGRGDELGQALEQLERGEAEDGPAVGCWAGQPVEEPGLG